MAAGTTYNVQQSKHATLTGGNYDTVNLAGCHNGIIRVRNRASSGAPIYFYVYESGVSPKTVPAAADDNTYVVPFADVTDVAWASPGATVILISADAQVYSVESLRGMN